MAWTFSTSTGWLWLLGLAWVVAAWLSWMHWRRHGGRKVLLMEGVRLAVVTAILLTLTQPEHVRQEPRTDISQVVILQDASGSMATRDIAPGGTGGELRSREAWLREAMADYDWERLLEGKEVVRESFGMAITNQEGQVQVPGTDLAGALQAVMETRPRLRAILLLSDGDWNEGESPLTVAAEMPVRGVKLFAAGIGREERLPDLELEPAAVPSFGLLGEQLSLPFRIRSSLARDYSARLTLQEAGGGRWERQVEVPSYGVVQDAFVWQPQRVGVYEFQLTLPVAEEEIQAANNQRFMRVEVRSEKLHVLVVDSRPRWEYRFLRNALERDPGVEVDCLLYHPGLGVGQGPNYLAAFPETKEALAKYDVVFLGDVGIGEGELAEEALERLRGLVEYQAAGLVFLPGMRGRQATLKESALAELWPVTLDDSQPKGIFGSVPSPLVLTSAGQNHFLTRLNQEDGGVSNADIWRTLPGFYWSAGVERARPGANVLAVHGNRRTESGRVPLLVTRPFGAGEVLFMGTDGAWRWRRGVEDTYHYRFWGQVVRWMAHKRHMAEGEGLRLSYSPENPLAGQTVHLTATVLDLSARASGATIVAQIESPSGEVESMSLSGARAGWGVSEGVFVPREGGDYRVVLKGESLGTGLETMIAVEEPLVEKIGQPANLPILREMAALTGGAFATETQFDSLARQIQYLPEPAPLEIRYRLWSRPWWGGLILFLLAVYWTARKAAGMF